MAPPCLGPFNDASDDTTAEYVSVPEDVTTCVVNVWELKEFTAFIRPIVPIDIRSSDSAEDEEYFQP